MDLQGVTLKVNDNPKSVSRQGRGVCRHRRDQGEVWDHRADDYGGVDKEVIKTVGV